MVKEVIEDGTDNNGRRHLNMCYILGLILAMDCQKCIIMYELCVIAVGVWW